MGSKQHWRGWQFLVSAGVPVKTEKQNLPGDASVLIHRNCNRVDFLNERKCEFKI